MKNIKKIISLLLILLFISTYCFAYDSSTSYIWSIETDTLPVNSSATTETNYNIENNNLFNLQVKYFILITYMKSCVLHQLQK